MHQVVVTGMGVVSAAGVGCDALEAAIREGRMCGSPDSSPLPVGFVGRVPDPIDAHPLFPDDRKSHLGLVALEECLEHPMGLEKARLALFLGTGLSSVTPHELAEDVFPHIGSDGGFDLAAMSRDIDPDRAAPRRHQPHRLTAYLTERLGVTGPSGTSFSACAAASQAMAQGLWTLRRGEADVALVGGQDSMAHPLGLLSFLVLGALSPDRCRPFDQHRDGFMLGEGAAMFMLETEEHARERGARILAWFLGAGSSIDAHNATAPHPRGEGAERSMRAALRDAGLEASSVGYVNAHGTGTPVGDVAEAAAIHRVCGDVATSSIKGSVGHTIAAAGAVEAAACLLALQGGFVPGNVGLEEPDPACEIQVPQKTESGLVSVALSNSFGFGGQNTTLAFGAVDG